MYPFGMPRPTLTQPCPVYPWLEILLGTAIAGVLFAGLTVACGSPSLLQCRAHAVESLPLDPDTITLGDVREVARKVRACQAGDGGLP